MAVLELGGGQRQLEKKLQKLFHSITYRSFDIDGTNYHDYYQLGEIDGKYNIACMIEVIEHVRPEEALLMLNKIHEVLEDDGLAILTTPNIYYPPEYLRDATHITPWCFDEMGSIVQLAGFEVINIYRLFSGNLKKKLLHRVLFYPVHRVLEIDFAKHIVIVAKKKS